MAARKKAPKKRTACQTDNPAGDPQSDLSSLIANLLAMMNLISERQEQFQAILVEEMKKTKKYQDRDDNLIPLMDTSASISQDAQAAELIEMPTKSISDIRIEHFHLFLETYVKDIEILPGGSKSLTQRLKKRIRWECEERAQEVCKEYGKLPSWKMLAHKKHLIRAIVAEAESLGIPIKRCEDFWPVVYLVKQHWSNKARYQKKKREKMKRCILEKRNQRGDVSKADNTIIPYNKLQERGIDEHGKRSKERFLQNRHKHNAGQAGLIIDTPRQRKTVAVTLTVY
ncbi:hypothetical protein BJV82DRAFT_579251 [Fennellomyces sp. T-0311]|nr:hypothetical protein BJV82DRAFT_579251 [Fennellomyces sp. T-0311]